LVLSTQTPEFEVILDQQVQARLAYLAVEIELLNAEEMTELHRLVMEIKSQIGDTCALFYWPHGLGEDSSPPPSPTLLL